MWREDGVMREEFVNEKTRERLGRDWVNVLRETQGLKSDFRV